MVRAEEMSILQADLERLRDRLSARNLTEGEMWTTVDRVSGMLEEARGGVHEQTLNVIYTLLSTVWANVCATSVLAQMRDELEGRDGGGR